MTFQEQVVNHSRQIENVLDTKKEITEEVMQRRLAIIHRKEIEAAQEEKKVRVFVHKYVSSLTFILPLSSWY